MEAEREFFSAGRRRSAGNVRESHATALAGALAGGGGRKDGPAEPRRLHRLPAGGIEPRAFAEHADFADLVQVDRGGELLRQHGDAAVEQYIEQLARALSSAVRQTDVAVKYTAWSLVFILPDTSLENAQALAEKLRQLSASVRPPGATPDLTISAVVAEASSRPGDETEDRVTEWINRAEAGLDDARQRGGNLLVALSTP